MHRIYEAWSELDIWSNPDVLLIVDAFILIRENAVFDRRC